jgi:hypothetical protein
VSDHTLDPPASAWIEGEWIIDEHVLSLPAELPPGSYTLVAGLYDAATGQRVPGPDGEWAVLRRIPVQ